MDSYQAVELFETLHKEMQIVFHRIKKFLKKKYFTLCVWITCLTVCPTYPQDQASKDKALQNMASLSSAQIVSPNLIKSQLPPLPQPPYAHPPRVSSSTLVPGPESFTH